MKRNTSTENETNENENEKETARSIFHPWISVIYKFLFLFWCSDVVFGGIRFIFLSILVQFKILRIFYDCGWTAMCRCECVSACIFFNYRCCCLLFCWCCGCKWTEFLFRPKWELFFLRPDDRRLWCVEPFINQKKKKKCTTTPTTVSCERVRITRQPHDLLSTAIKYVETKWIFIESNGEMHSEWFTRLSLLIWQNYGIRSSLFGRYELLLPERATV